MRWIVFFMLVAVLAVVVFSQPVESSGYTRAHVECFSGAKKIYNGYGIGYLHRFFRYGFIDESTGKRIMVTGNCVAQEE